MDPEKAPTRPPPMNAYGYPRASPYFSWMLSPCCVPENNIRKPMQFCPCQTCHMSAGPDTPDHFYDGGQGWVTYYFTDVEPFSFEEKKAGRYRCTVRDPNTGQECNWQVAGETRCETICWIPKGAAATSMAEHLTSVHGFQPPGKREWATELCDTQGCFDVWFCVQCQGSRQIMAGYGHKNTFNWWVCLFLCLAGCDCERGEDGQTRISYNPPWCLAAMLTRRTIRVLNNIDEGMCGAGCKAICCPCCSLAQTYREYSAAGVWPGGTCCSTEEPTIPLKPPIKEAK